MREKLNYRPDELAEALNITLFPEQRKANQLD